MLRLLLAHMASTSKRVMLAMVLDRVDAGDLGSFKPTNHPGLQSAAEA
ncbi:hypothetical protein SynBIOSE41_03836 [Synechococcus sp. BIOS-E4-1]|nr:hypothetical protein SynBIOSE41_03836 [Synechococcus sp. BIOS-E4-1]